MHPYPLNGPLAQVRPDQWRDLADQVRVFHEVELSVRTDMPKFGVAHNQAVDELAAMIKANIWPYLESEPGFTLQSHTAGENAVVRYHVRRWPNG